MAAPDPTDIQLGQRIAALRKAQGLTMRELAARLGWPHTTLGNYEAGRRSLTPTRLTQIARALNLPPAALLAESAEIAAIIAQVSTDEERRLQVVYFLESLGELPEAPQMEGEL
jgi:transcriptional regulator with XRE-family HTH domain